VPLFAVYGWTLVLNVIVILISLVLMFIVLIQRGKGGGLIGAFGGAGGSSPFGSRAGDTFVTITGWIAAFWVVFIMIQTKIAAGFDSDSRPPSQTEKAPAEAPPAPAPAQ
jgi:preprotein translocase subunit SecG